MKHKYPYDKPLNISGTFNRETIDKFREYFLDKNKTIEIINQALDFNLRNEKEYPNEINSLAKYTYTGYINQIFRDTESPIEKIFLNSFLFRIASLNPFGIDITPKYELDGTQHKTITKGYEQLRIIYEDIYKKGAITKFGEFLFNEKLYENLDLANYSSCVFFCYYLFGGSVDKPHISIQPKFTGIMKHNKTIRPDIYIWNPTIKEYNYIIELDGYKYHSDKISFAKDRIRDRLLQLNNYNVLRFSGKEIYHNYFDCAEEMIELIFSKKECDV